MKIYIYGGVACLISLVITYNTPYWSTACPAINRGLVHWNVGPVLDCTNDDNKTTKKTKSALEHSIKMQEMLDEVLNDAILRQLPRNHLETILESEGFDPDSVSYLANKVLDYKPTQQEIDSAYKLQRQLSRLSTKHIEAIIKAEFHPNIIPMILNSTDITIIEPEPQGPFGLTKLNAKLSTIIPSAKTHYETIPDNAEMCDNENTVRSKNIEWKLCVCLKVCDSQYIYQIANMI